MRLLVDAGNTRLKWRLDDREGAVAKSGVCLCDSGNWLDDLASFAPDIERIAVSTVMSESRRHILVDQLNRLAGTDVHFYWSEARRAGLINAYSDTAKMGADRWHAMYAGWRQKMDGFAVVDAGSAITVDYVAPGGVHLGGYILPGRQMMLRSLRQDAARIGFQEVETGGGQPGVSTTECVQHGVVWLWEGLIQHLVADCREHGLERILCTGGDAGLLLSAGLPGEYDPDLVIKGLAAIDSESAGV